MLREGILQACILVSEASWSPIRSAPLFPSVLVPQWEVVRFRSFGYTKLQGFADDTPRNRRLHYGFPPAFFER